MQLSKKAKRQLLKFAEESYRNLKDVPDYHVGSLRVAYQEGWNGMINLLEKELHKEQTK